MIQRGQRHAASLARQDLALAAHRVRLARMAAARAPGRDGLFFVLAGGWWLAGLAGWLSMERTWPLLFVALGVGVMFQSVAPGASTPRNALPAHGRRRGGASPLMCARDCRRRSGEFRGGRAIDVAGQLMKACFGSTR